MVLSSKNTGISGAALGKADLKQRLDLEMLPDFGADEDVFRTFSQVVSQAHVGPVLQARGMIYR